MPFQYQIGPFRAPLLPDDESISSAPSKLSYNSNALLDKSPFLLRTNSFGSTVTSSKTSYNAEPPPVRAPFNLLRSNSRRSVAPEKTSYHSLQGELGDKKEQDFWQHTRKSFFLKIGAVFVLLQLLFLGNLSYLYGSLWGSNGRVSSLNVLWLDLDGGVIGNSVSSAYESLRGPEFPSLEKPSGNEFHSVAEALDAVRSGSYWAAFVVNTNASVRLARALAGGQAAQTYQASDALTYIWNEVRYPPFSDEALEANFELLAQVAEQEYHHRQGQTEVQKLNRNDTAAVQVLFHPIGVSAVNIMKTTNPTRLLYNTATMVMPVLEQFFFVLILNGLSDELGIYKKVPATTTGIIRVAFAFSYTLLSALGMTAYIWAFRETWSVDGEQFGLTWMTLWLLHSVHFVVVDTAAAFWPVPVMPFFILTWIVLNLSSSVSPLELNADFYRWGYALPDNEAYSLLTDIWSHGAVPVLHRALPILFAWLLVGSSAAIFGHFRRCRLARDK
ncbi:uncharacterized protein Z520_10524 [Fonsecaea multimorphosa CBS 102226]|uniref:DUF3533 domain-containing protein n=1 Tax=Fonsecaea multimorphosa CBS 102226 TaxID=1442371 RepID=A0A0D2JTW1_9EURO|nr:uncharacterized protein Z520_10524 [Fonsecaea multimorphosa CBS 102226]KIX93899.1 hypothetical protein Z520_10524 [Fonsecaea multimorphosa CBS 102226]OAL19136.1 hypothetical protein AYO22_10084 [Fonsecaea multimorphosa]